VHEEVPLALVLDAVIHHMLGVHRRDPRFRMCFLLPCDAGCWSEVVVAGEVTTSPELLVGMNGSD
jgi:hypothetical protein